MTKENDKLKDLMSGMEAMCFSCGKMGPFRVEDTEWVCERCGFHEPHDWRLMTRKFRRMPEGLMPVREETKI